MTNLSSNRSIALRIFWVCLVLVLLLGVSMLVGLGFGSTSQQGMIGLWNLIFSGDGGDSTMSAIIWRIRFPRVLMAMMAGAVLSTGGLVFQALLRNPLAEPYILGISGGSAIGAIIGIILGFSRFPG